MVNGYELLCVMRSLCGGGGGKKVQIEIELLDLAGRKFNEVTTCDDDRRPTTDDKDDEWNER